MGVPTRLGALALGLVIAGSGLVVETQALEPAPSCTKTGTAGRDLLYGTSGNDVLCGLGGNDVIRGVAGDDVLIGGPGADRLEGGNGNDSLQGEGGNDTLIGGAGADVFVGGGESDLVRYDDRNLAVFVSVGVGADDGPMHERDDVRSDIERVWGGPGDDRISNAGTMAVQFRGLNGHDQLTGGPAADRLEGGNGNEILRGKGGADEVLCGRGSDGYDDDSSDIVGSDCEYVNPNRPPWAVDDRLSTSEDTLVEVETAALLANDTDADDDPLVVTSVAVLNDGSVHGTVSLEGLIVRFMPDPEFSGTADFRYWISDGEAVASATVTVTVQRVDDRPVAVDDTSSVLQDRSVDILTSKLLANDKDVDSPALTVTGAQGTSNGRAELAGSTVTFTPTAGFCGMAGFSYVVSDGNSSDVGHVAVTVRCDPHITTGVDHVTGREDTLLTVPVSTLLANDVDAEGDPLTIEGVGAYGGDAWIEGDTVYFMPDQDWYGDEARIFYGVTDGTGTAVGTVEVWIEPVNDPPFTWFQFEHAGRDTPLVLDSGDFEGFDIDWDVLTVSAVSNPLHGTVTVSDGTVTFVPQTGYCGDDAGFDFTLSDGEYEATDHMYVDVWSQSCAGS